VRPLECGDGVWNHSVLFLIKLINAFAEQAPLSSTSVVLLQIHLATYGFTHEQDQESSSLDPEYEIRATTEATKISSGDSSLSYPSQLLPVRILKLGSVVGWSLDNISALVVWCISIHIRKTTTKVLLST
jgi:hypothetical protein